MPSYADLSNEVWVGAGGAVTFVPESHIYLGASITYVNDGSEPFGSTITITNADFEMVPNIYTGCTIKIHNASVTQFAVIKSNAETTIEIAEVVNTDLASGNAATKAWILPFGAPCPAPQPTTNATNETSLLADNWLGLVNTFSPPNVEVEMGQLNLALAGTRNFRMQFKKGETVSGGSLDVSMNHGAWLYYALGKIGSVSHNATATALSGSTAANTIVTSGDNKTDFYRVLSDGAARNAFPPTNLADAALFNVGTPHITYTFTESNGQELPSFALEMTLEKEGIDAANYYVGSNNRSDSDASGNVTDDTNTTSGTFNTSNDEIYCRVFTGCQVNSTTINFEEGQEVKQTLDLVTRRAFDVPNGYSPKRNVRTGTKDDLDNFGNYLPHESTRSAALQDRDKQPYMFSSGELTVFGNTVSRVKSGSITINNNIGQHRFIGNYDREITSAHIPAQRTYEIALTMLVTDSDLWNDMRAKSGENLGSATKIKVRFSKDGTFDNATVDDYISLEFQDFMTQSVEFPFPDDKGPIEVNVTFSARTLSSAMYSGPWVILNQENNN